MTSYGFDEDSELPILPKKTNKGPAASKLVDAIAVGNKLGFVSRMPVDVPKTRRQTHSEPQGKLLITGPSRVLDELRRRSVELNVPYWRIIEELFSNNIT